MDLRNLADTYEQTQRVRIQAENRVRAVFQGSDEEVAEHVANDRTIKRLRYAEEDVKLQMEDELKNHPCYVWAMGVPGLNRTLAAKIFGLIGDVERFARFSNLRTFSGHTPGKNRLVKGEKSCFNRRLKTCCYLFFESSIKVASIKLKFPPEKKYADIYRNWRSVYLQRYGAGDIKKKENSLDKDGNRYTFPDEVAKEWPDIRQHYAAKNKLVDVFLFHVYEEWLEKIGSDKKATLYSHEVLGHHMKFERSDFSNPKMSEQKRKQHKSDAAAT